MIFKIYMLDIYYLWFLWEFLEFVRFFLACVLTTSAESPLENNEIILLQNLYLELPHLNFEIFKHNIYIDISLLSSFDCDWFYLLITL